MCMPINMFVGKIFTYLLLLDLIFQIGYHCTEMRFILCTWFGEFCSCCSLTALPGLAWVLLNWICKELISSMYINAEFMLL